MALAITYTDHTEAHMCITLQTGDTLAAGAGFAAVPGPATLLFPVDGTPGNRYYLQAAAAGLIATATKPARPPKPV